MLKRIMENFILYNDKSAFCIKDRFYTYRDLQIAVSSIQGQIDDIKGKISEKRIAVICNDDFETYASLFAIWFSGFAYVPLGLHNPIDRNLTILKEANINTIISSTSIQDSRYSTFLKIQPEITGEDLSELELPETAQEDLMYILFTSGSTGLPKGVPISYKNLTSFVTAFEGSPFNIIAEDKCLQMFELTFDVSVSSFLIPLLNGACVYTVPNNVIKYVHILKLLSKYGLTSIQIVPSIIRLAQPLLSKFTFPSVRNCILTGEATFVDLLDPWRRCIPGARIFNFYGPTESTIYCAYYELEPGKSKSYNGMLAIGKAIENMELIIIDEEGKELGANEKGELLISGPQLTQGYLDIEKSKTSFIRNQALDQHAVYYRSGDLCFVDEDGDILYCGRLDNQVKIQGFRVELSEIEILVRSSFNVNNVVIATKNNSGIMELGLILEAGTDMDYTAIVSHLKEKLPQYMIPVKISTLKEFPLNSSGKTDRNKIKELVNGTYGK